MSRMRSCPRAWSVQHPLPSHQRTLVLVPVQVLGLEPVLVLVPVRSPSSVDDVFIVPVLMF